MLMCVKINMQDKVLLKYIIKRLLIIIPTALGVVVLTFLLLHLSPGDPVEVLLGEQALPADKESLRQALGLHLPLHEQFTHFFGNLLQGDLGKSLFNEKDVTTLILSRLPATLELAAAAIIFAMLLALPLGIWSALHKNKWQDKSVIGYTMVAFAMPSFWLGPLLMILLSIKLDLLPVSGREGWQSLIMPAITLGLAMSAMTARLLRSSILESMNSDYVRTAIAKGIPQKKAVWKHALKNALLPVVTIVFLQAAALLTGAILTEAVFSWPGIGSLIVESLQRRDYAVVQGCVLFIALVYMIMTFVSDIVYALCDPRIRYGEGK